MTFYSAGKVEGVDETQRLVDYISEAHADKVEPLINELGKRLRNEKLAHEMFRDDVLTFLDDGLIGTEALSDPVEFKYKALLEHLKLFKKQQFGK